MNRADPVGKVPPPPLFAQAPREVWIDYNGTFNACPGQANICASRGAAVDADR